MTPGFTSLFYELLDDDTSDLLLGCTQATWPLICQKNIVWIDRIVIIERPVMSDRLHDWWLAGQSQWLRIRHAYIAKYG